MRKIFSISRKQTTILITLVVLALAAAWYYFDYIPKNEQAVDELHFRWLQNADKNVREKIVGVDTLLANLLNAYINSDASPAVERYISNYSIPDATFSANYNQIDTAGKKNKTVTKNNKPLTDTNNVLLALSWDSLTDRLTFTASKKVTEKNQQFNVVMTSDFGKFISSLLTPDLFEHYVVFYNGRYIYEDFHSGLGYSIKYEDSLLTTGKGMTGASIIKQKIGGIDYQMFLQPINFFSSGRLIIAGLLTQKRIDAEKKQLPAGIIILAIIIALGILLFLPWIKIYFQGKYDKINLKDAASSAVVAKLLISLIVLLFFTYNNPFRPDIENDSKNFLANTIGSSFTREIDSAFMCLNNFDSVARSDRMFYNVIHLANDTLKYKRNPDIFTDDYESLPNPFKKLSCSIKYAEVNWLDSTGMSKYGWTTANQNNIPANYNYRSYFKKIIDGNTISLKIAPDSAVVIDQIVSRTSGVFRTTISKPSVLNTLDTASERAKVVALSFTVKSLDSVIMPAGYSFAIIDNNGDVKYHSKSVRNLNENLLEEFSNREELEDALVGGFTEKFITNYYEGEYSVLVKPIKGLPYFIVIMSDQSFPGSVQIETFSFTWGMILVFLLVVMLDLFILIVASSRRSLFKKQYFVTSWIWPRKCSANEYCIAIIGNLIMIAVLILIPFLFPHFYDYLSYLFVLFFSIPISTIFINKLFLYKYKHEKNETYQNYKVNCHKYSSGFLIVLNIFAFILLTWNTYWHVLLFEGIMIAALYSFFLLRKTPESGTTTNNNKHEDRFIRYYVWMIFTRLIITSAIPALFFYIASYNYENNMLARYRQYDFLKQLQRKFTGQSSSAAAKYNNGVYPDSIWINSFDTTENAPQHNVLTKSQINTAGLFNSFGFYLEDVATVNNDNFYQSSSDDSSLHFNNFFDSVLYARKSNNKLFANYNFFKKPVDSTKNISTVESKHVTVISKNLNYTFPGTGIQNGFMFWLLLLAALWCFYLILREVIKKVCSLNLDAVTVLKNARITADDLIAKKEERLLWIIGLPVDETLEQVKAKLKDDIAIPYLDFDNVIINNKKSNDVSVPFTEEGVYVIQLKAAENRNNKWEDIKSSIKNAEAKFVLVLNIENNLDDEAVTNEKLQCIKELFDAGKKIRIVSAMHPLKMLEILNHKKDDNTTHLDTAAARLMYLTLEQAPVVILPLIKNNLNNISKTGAVPVDLFLDKELRYTQFLKRLYAKSLLTYKEKGASNKGKKDAPKFREDKLTLRIQFLANNFYMGIWRSLSSDEKFILCDLAADGLVNITNTTAMSMLMSKGLIVEEEGYLHIFNRSFRNFILTNVDSTELAHLQMLHNKHSNWSSLQTPLLIVVLVVFVFLAIAQEGLYSRVIAIISSIAAGIPALLKILSMFGTSNTRDVKNTPQE